MQYLSIVRWVVGLCTGLRRSQAKTLGHLVGGALRCRRVSIAGIGRCLQSGALVKHSIKRVYRFLANERIEAPLACRALIGLVAAKADGRLWVTVDWTDIGPYKVLAASVPLGGRSVPILFAAYRKWNLRRSQNAFEEGFFKLLAALVPPAVQAVIVADRGFARADLFHTLRALGLSWVIRLPLNVCFEGETYCGRLDDLPVRPRTHKDLGFGRYRKNRPVRMRVVFWWKQHQKDPWLLGTDLQWSWRKVCAAYGLRMQIEELFRDHKGLRHGWGLRAVSLSAPERLERLLLVLALAYLLLVLMGLECRSRLSERHWAAGLSRNKHQASIFFVGRFMQTRRHFRLRTLLRLLASQLTRIIKENWG
jgi:hypothetical protein